MATQVSATANGFRLVAPMLLGLVLAASTPGQAQDYQRIPLGAQRVPFAPLILSGPPGQPPLNNGICDDAIVPGGDDVVRVPAGKSQPQQIVIAPGSNGTLQSSPAGDDVSSAAICPGADLVIQSSLNPADILPVDDTRCQLLCANTSACILPGDDGTLQTAVNPLDVSVPVILSGPDGIAQTSATPDDVQRIPVGQGFKDTVCIDVGANGTAETSICGNGIDDFEEDGIPGDAECDDHNFVNGDGCDANCTPTACGNGIVTAGEECDDGNRRNDDACVAGCKNAVCGDGFRQLGVEECDPPVPSATCNAACERIPTPCGNGTLDPLEQCDDGNHSDRDDCPTTCENARCGDGFLHKTGTPPFEQCDDGNTLPGDGCSATCTLECGNGVIDGACSEPAARVGQPCTSDPNCDLSPGSGDGVCVFFEECDPGLASLCTAGPPVCSNKCKVADCGNGVTECGEECDLGVDNGLANRGCDVDCTRKSIERPLGRFECLHTWTLDSAPVSLERRTQICRDGDPACDFDAVAGQCTFRIGSCLNRTGVSTCTPGGILTFDLRRLHVDRPAEAAVIEAITGAVADLSPGTTIIPGRCRKGLRNKVCSIPDDNECDTFFGAGDGACDLGFGVQFGPLFEAVDQCTASTDVVIAAGKSLTMRARVSRTTGPKDLDLLRLICRSALG